MVLVLLVPGVSSQVRAGETVKQNFYLILVFYVCAGEKWKTGLER